MWCLIMYSFLLTVLALISYPLTLKSQLSSNLANTVMLPNVIVLQRAFKAHRASHGSGMNSNITFPLFDLTVRKRR